MAKRQRATEELGDVIHLRGCMEFELRDAASGEVLRYDKHDNLVVTAGRRWVLQKIGSFSNQTNAINAIAVGTSTTAPATNDSALGSEITATVGRLTIGTFTTTGLDVGTPSWRAEVQFANDQANNTIGEAGLFNTSAATAGTLFSRLTFSTFQKATSNTLSVSYTISN